MHLQAEQLVDILARCCRPTTLANIVHDLDESEPERFSDDNELRVDAQRRLFRQLEVLVGKPMAFNMIEEIKS